MLQYYNFTMAVLNKEDYLLTDFKYDEENISRLSLKSVRDVVSSRAMENGGALVVQFGNIFAYFIDNTETLFQAMRKVKLDPKYNKIDQRLKNITIPFIIRDDQTRKTGQLISDTFFDVKKQINVILKNARAKLIRILDPVYYEKFMKRLQKIDVETQNSYKQDFSDLCQILLNKIVDIVILKLPGTYIQNSYETKKQIVDSRRSTVSIIEGTNKLFHPMFAACESMFTEIVQPDIDGSQAGRLRNSRINPSRRARASNNERSNSVSYMAVKFLSKWYQLQQKKPNWFQFEMLIEQFGPRKNAVRDIVKYLNHKRIFYFYNFSSSVYALAYFMKISGINEIDFLMGPFKLTKTN